MVWDSEGSCKEFKGVRHDNSLSVAEVIKPIFQDFTREKLLTACMHGGTKNQNEPLNSLIWQRATKETHSSLPTIQLSTYLAIGYFNEGAKTLENILLTPGIVPGRFSESLVEKSNQERIYRPKVKSSEKAMKMRRGIRNKTIGYCEAVLMNEGLQYEIRAFKYNAK